MNAIGGLGLNAAFLKFGRDDEYQADQLGAEIMAGAGYNPVAMADFFELLRGQQGRDPGKLEQFFSDHPPSADREARIREQAGSLRAARSRDVGGFDRMRAELRVSLPLPRRLRSAWRSHENQDRRNAGQGRYDVRVDPPSSRFQRFEQRNGLFTIEHPENWRAYASDCGYAVSFAPEGGVVDAGDGQRPCSTGSSSTITRPSRARGTAAASKEHNYVPFEDTDALAREPGGRYRRPRPTDPPIELVPARRGRLRHGESGSTEPRPTRWRSPAARRSRGRRRG